MRSHGFEKLLSALLLGTEKAVLAFPPSLKKGIVFMEMEALKFPQVLLYFIGVNLIKYAINSLSREG